MTSEVFNGNRFLTYFKYDLTRMWRSHMKAAIVIGLMGLFGYFIYVFFGLISRHFWHGPGIETRLALFLVAGTVLELYQTRTYGHLTDKREGSAFLMLPASTLEKWLSMLIQTLVVIPLLFLAASFGVDALLAWLDPTVGTSMAAFITGGPDMPEVAGNTEGMPVGTILALLLGSFCLNYLYFLLCGICFKKRKIAWAFLIILGISMLLPLLVTPVALNEDISWSEPQLLRFLTGFTVTIWVIVAGLAGAIFYRLKTLKH